MSVVPTLALAVSPWWSSALIGAQVLLAGGVGALVLALAGDSGTLARPGRTVRGITSCAAAVGLLLVAASALAGANPQWLGTTPWFPLLMVTGGLGVYKSAGRVARPGRRRSVDAARDAARREIGEPWGETLSLRAVRGPVESAGAPRRRPAAPRRSVSPREPQVVAR
jgi:hypothetical protein